mmetsp:Transcript_39787/g.81210  ORF Transcript_39787/g.81210 Transcript_39787/m.81210 type:complete len:205 (-) Transcript_39787:32-646(-)
MTDQIEQQDLREYPTPDVVVFSFCSLIPANYAEPIGSLQEIGRVNKGNESASGGSMGVVGTVTFVGKSAMVWFGWGDTDQRPLVERDAKSSLKLGNGLPVMGCMSMSTPRSNYSGAMHDGDPPSTQLVGGPSEEDMVLGMQMSTRLAKRTGWPVFVSCGLNAASGEGMEGMGAGTGGMLGQKMAALAEREAGRIILRRRKMVEG